MALNDECNRKLIKNVFQLVVLLLMEAVAAALKQVLRNHNDLGLGDSGSRLVDQDQRWPRTCRASGDDDKRLAVCEASPAWHAAHWPWALPFLF